MSTDKAQLARHLRFNIALAAVTMLLSYATVVYLRYAARDAGRALESTRLAAAWSLPAVFAAAAIAGFCVVAKLRRGTDLGNARFLPLAIVLIGVPVQLAVVRMVA